MWLRRHPDKAISQQVYWPPPGSIWILSLKHQGTGGKIIQISLITTPTEWKLAVHVGNQTQPTGGVNRRKHIESMSIFPMWRATYSLSYHMVLKWRPVYPFAEMLSAGGSQKPQARPFAKKSLNCSLPEPLTGLWHALTQDWMQW